METDEVIKLVDNIYKVSFWTIFYIFLLACDFCADKLPITQFKWQCWEKEFIGKFSSQSEAPAIFQLNFWKACQCSTNKLPIQRILRLSIHIVRSNLCSSQTGDFEITLWSWTWNWIIYYCSSSERMKKNFLI